MTVRDEILSAPDLARETVKVPEWGRAVEVRELTALDRLECDEADTAALPGARSRLRSIARILARSLHDPATGDRIFGPEDEDALMGRNARVLVRLFKIAARLSGEEGTGDGLTGKD